MATQTKPVINIMFDLVAPIAICGGADCMFEKKAIAAWKKIVQTRHELPWKTNVGIDPRNAFELIEEWDPRDPDDFQSIYYDFAKPVYDALFEEIVNQNGDDKWEQRVHDYWGAKGFMRPGDSNKSLSLAGDAGGQYPWYETAELLIARIKSREQERP